MVSDERGDAVIAAQIEYYRVRAPEYDETFRGSHDPSLVAALDACGPGGRVLELACGTGAWTEAIVRHNIESLLAVDAAPEMLAFHERRIRDPRVRREVANLFAWEPPARFDIVTFAFWLSHVPPARFETFWRMVDVALEPHGTVLFVDQDDRAASWEEIGGDSDYPTVARPLSNGRTMTAIKVYHRPDRLEARLRSLGWDISVRAAGDGFLVGSGRRASVTRVGGAAPRVSG